MTIKNAIPKFIALLLVSVLAAFFAMSTDDTILAKLDSMTATAYVESQRKLFHKSFLHHFILWAIIGGLYVASVEFIAYFIAFCFKRRPAA